MRFLRIASFLLWHYRQNPTQICIRDQIKSFCNLELRIGFWKPLLFLVIAAPETMSRLQQEAAAPEPDVSVGRLSGATLGKSKHKHLPKVSKFKFGKFWKKSAGSF